MKLIIGLGNPGKEYENTRHNIGFKVIDAYASHINVDVTKSKKNAHIYKGNGFILAKPKTYMNLSGDPVSALIKFFKVEPKDVLIIYDDMDTNVGKAVMKPKGSAGGQNGMKDIIEKMGTQEIQRLKVGIGRPNNNSKNHVLGQFSKIQIEKLNLIKESLVKAVDLFISDGFTKSSNFLNALKKK